MLLVAGTEIIAQIINTVISRLVVSGEAEINNVDSL